MLIDYLKNYKTISIVGMAKNAGKTVTLNALLDEIYENGNKVGLTSIGRDGESKDIVTTTVKPMIYAYENTLIATSENLFELSEAKLEILEVTDFTTSMGRIVIGKVIHPGYVQIAGPCNNTEINLVNKKMMAYGAEYIIVDGAIDRKSTASPAITDATILSTGAVLSRDMQKVIEKTVYQVTLFNLKGFQGSKRAIAQEAIGAKKITLLGDDVRHLDIKTALNAGHTIAAALKEDTTHVIIPGSLVGKTLMDIVKNSVHYKHVTFVVRDATRIFIDYKDWIYFDKLKVKVKVMDEIKLLAVTINPSSPEGYYFDKDKFEEELKVYLGNLDVINVL